MGAIVTGSPFVLAGTEVFHTVCATTQGTHNSIAARQGKAIAELRIHNENISTDLRIIKNRVQDEMKRAHDALEDAQEAEASWRRRYQEARNEWSVMQAEVQRLRRELEEARALRVDANTPVLPAPDTRDATEIRFSLLELDGDD